MVGSILYHNPPGTMAFSITITIHFLKVLVLAQALGDRNKRRAMANMAKDRGATSKQKTQHQYRTRYKSMLRSKRSVQEEFKLNWCVVLFLSQARLWRAAGEGPITHPIVEQEGHSGGSDELVSEAKLI